MHTLARPATMKICQLSSHFANENFTLFMLLKYYGNLISELTAEFLLFDKEKRIRSYFRLPVLIREQPT